MTMVQQIIMVAAAVAATMMTRFIPFMVFRPGKPTPRIILYLGQVLPASVFALLVVYCLRSIIALEHTPSGNWHLALSPDITAQLASVGITLAIHFWRRNMMWSIAAGTLSYMLLIRWL